jgi:hypothetical protein
VKYVCTFKCGFEGSWQAVQKHLSQHDCHLALQNDKNSTAAALNCSLLASSGGDEEGTWAKHRPVRVDAQQLREKLDTFVAPRSISISAPSEDDEEGTWAKHRPLRVDAQQLREKLDTFVAPRSILKKSSSDGELDVAGQDGRHAAAGACLKKSNSDSDVPSYGARKSNAVNLPHTTRDEGAGGGSKKGVAGFISKLSKFVRDQRPFEPKPS